jgi:hypothetical protein
MLYVAIMNKKEVIGKSEIMHNCCILKAFLILLTSTCVLGLVVICCILLKRISQQWYLINLIV